MKQEQIVNEFAKVADVRVLLLTHPDQDMVRDACLHFLGDDTIEWYRKHYEIIPKSVSHGFNMGHMSSEVVAEEVSWKTVFNTSHRTTFWGGIDHAEQTAYDAGYKYYSWNGWVYSVKYGKTDITTDQLDGKK